MPSPQKSANPNVLRLNGERSLGRSPRNGDNVASWGSELTTLPGPLSFLRRFPGLRVIDRVEANLPASAGQVMAEGLEVGEELPLQLVGPLRFGVGQVLGLARV